MGEKSVSKKIAKDYKNYSKLKNYVKKLLFKKRFLLRLNHNPISFNFKTATVPAPSSSPDDKHLIERLKKTYKMCNAVFEGNKDSMWSHIFMNLHGEIHLAFNDEDNEKITDILRNPGNYNFFYGFENLCIDLVKSKRLEDVLEPQMTMDCLISFCEAAGVITMSNPESLRIHKAVDPEKAIQLLEREFGLNLVFPNPFQGEYGIKTNNGIISYRAIQAAFQAWKISGIVNHVPNPRVLEIGGGLGRTAYFCKLFGITDYTIVDIPISSLAQGDFLGRVLPEKDLSLFGEPNDNENTKIKLIPPEVFFSSDRKYDLIVNVDSLTELDINIAKKYLQKIGDVGARFLSVNHEKNSFTVNSIWKESPYLKKLYRNPYWLRRGYIEELFENNHF